MFSTKLRSWMEAVRPRKKQQRKDKQKNIEHSNGTIISNYKNVSNSRLLDNDSGHTDSKSIQTIASQGTRYFGANLSSPESAYSTGYSTDGTSPGAPPDYYLNIRSDTGKCSSAIKANYRTASSQEDKPIIPRNETSNSCEVYSSSEDRVPVNAKVQVIGECNSKPMISDYEAGKYQTGTIIQAQARLAEVIVSSGITSPRQRNRIRTNPWVPGNNLSPGSSCAGLHVRQEAKVINSPLTGRYFSPTVPCSPINNSARCESLSSSTCSSLSASSLNWDANLVKESPGRNLLRAKNSNRSLRVQSASDEEDDCTLNEMMGKYDESYVYEKETDILSDSDPTDCDTDIDTGQDGGDEEEPLENEFDFIDNGSYLEFNVKEERNTGHCTYFNFDTQRKCSRKKNMKRSQKESTKGSVEKRRRSSSSKKKHKYSTLRPNTFNFQDGTRSAGATPISVRRTKHPTTRPSNDDRRRSNSVSIPRDKVFDQRDKEADKKYKELIVEADNILKNMKYNGLSPRRVLGPTNKRVELLRTENTKPEIFMKNRLIEDVSNLHLTRLPSNFSPRFSPKRNHITKFINNNSPILLRREYEKANLHNEFVAKKLNSPLLKKHQKTELPSKRSPKYRRDPNKLALRDSLSSDSESDQKTTKPRNPPRNTKPRSFGCPLSEPLKRKIYTGQAEYAPKCLHSKVVESEVPTGNLKKSCECLRQQVLVNTITNLKRSLEDQSASLKQVYRSSNSLHV